MPLPATRRINRNSARDSVHEKLRDWIIRGPLEPGEMIRDTEIADRLGVSRTPVREALVRLEQAGLVEILPGRWTRVSLLPFDQAGNLYAIGAVLDGLAAEQSASRLSESDLEQMRRTNDRMLEIDDPLGLQNLDEAFYGVYVRAAANPRLEQLHDSVRNELRRFERVNFRDRLTPEVAHREHSAILSALRARDAARAREAARFNWANAWTRVEAMVADAARAADGVNKGAGTSKRREEVAR